MPENLTFAREYYPAKTSSGPTIYGREPKISMIQPHTTARLTALAALTFSLSYANAQKFDFGTDAAMSGTRAVTSTTRYSAATGFGLEGTAQVTVFGDTNTDGLMASAPFRFSAAVPEGVYDVTIVFGNPTAATATTVLAEARRLMLENVETAPGKTETRTFTVAVKRPELKVGGKVGLKTSQRLTNWDEKLTLEFNGAHPSVCSVEIAPAVNPVGIFIAGDSTVTDQAGEPYTGWGQMLPRFFKAGAFVWNEAQSGETLSSFENAHLLQKIWENARPGDYLFIQFGHNDQKDKHAGAGPFTSYKSNLKKYVAGARERGLIPILVTPMERRRYSGGQFSQTLTDFAEAVRQTGAEAKVPVIDLNAQSQKFYAALGGENSKTAFVYYAANSFPGQTEALHDDTHFSSYGAYELARMMTTAIADQKLGLAPLLTDDFVAFDPSQPDDVAALALPVSPPELGFADKVSKPEGS